jgi:hypothetical protein
MFSSAIIFKKKMDKVKKTKTFISAEKDLKMIKERKLGKNGIEKCVHISFHFYLNEVTVIGEVCVSFMFLTA